MGSGEAGQDASKANKAMGQAFTIMRQIVTVGWAIYPAGYFFGYLCGTVDASTLNLVYNLADFVNKIAFVLAIWAGPRKTQRGCAASSSERPGPRKSSKEALLP